MAYEEVLKLFYFYWFENGVLRNKTKPSSSNPVLDMHDEEFEPSPLKKLSETPSFIVRSFSDQALSSKDISTLLAADSSPSPKSVFLAPKLETILSGKEVGEFSSEPEAKNYNERNGESNSDEGGKLRRRRKGRGTYGSRSLSELEFEELKGFMDLGFVFSDEDKDSSLASIIPGLQRLGKRVGVAEENDGHKTAFVEESSTVPRPYLSEAWDVLDEMKSQKLMVQNQLMNWRVSATGNTDLEIKDQLRFWAYTVASTVR